MFEIWKNTSKVAKWTLLVGGGLILILSSVFYIWVTAIQYAVLYSDLTEQEAAQITKALTAAKFDYKLRQGGKTILVNEQQISEIRLRISESHLPLSGGQGFELFDDVNYGMTEFVQNINYQRAMQGELARTIAAMPEIKSARVHLVLPKESLFQKNKHKRTASVTLTMNAGKLLSSEQVAGIQHLVASSVEAMNTKDVLILDENGIALSSIEDPNQISLGFNFQFKKQVEEYLAYKASKVIDAVLDNESGYVYIDADINFDEVNITQEIYQPQKISGKGVIVKSKVVTSFRENSVDKSESRNADKQETTEYEYKISKSIEQIMQSKGGLKRLSISVVLPEGIGSEKLDAIEHLIMTAVGFNEARGDQISIQSLTVSSPSNEPVAIKTEHSAKVSKLDMDNQDIATHNPRDTFNKTWLTIAAFIIGFLSLLYAVLYSVFSQLQKKKKEDSPTPLSADEREKLLADIKEWLHT